MKLLTRSEVSRHNKINDAWIIIHNHVYDHPGGKTTLLDHCGTDASEIFEKIMHTDFARDLMKDLLIGKLDISEETAIKVSTAKIMTFDQVMQENSKGKFLMIIHNKVYDLTKFKHEHPGGYKVLEEQMHSKDSFETFEDVGHSDEARQMMSKYFIAHISKKDAAYRPTISKMNTQSNILLPIVVVIAGILIAAAYHLGYF